MPKLHQILALEKGIKNTTESQITRARRDAGRTSLFNGMTRVYKPKDDDDTDRLPAEKKLVQLTTSDVFARAVDGWVRQADIIATKDSANQTATADVNVNGTVVATDVPVTTLLHLEKMLTNVHTFVSELPTLDPEVDWGTGPDPSTGLWRSQPEETVRTRKIPKAFVKSAATDKFPAQVDTYTEDVIVGTWERTLHSGAMPAPAKGRLLRRIEELQGAVKMAREFANTADAPQRDVAAGLFEYLQS